MGGWRRLWGRVRSVGDGREGDDVPAARGTGVGRPGAVDVNLAVHLGMHGGSAVGTLCSCVGGRGGQNERGAAGNDTIVDEAGQVEVGEHAPSGCYLEFEGGRRERVWGSCTIGRSSQNRVVLEDGLISRFHALLQAQDVGEYVLVDLGSSNGTFLNGRRLGLPTRLCGGDCIRVGRVELVFRRDGTARMAEGEAVRRTQSTELAGVVEHGLRWLLVADLVAYSELSRGVPAADLAQRVGVWIHDCKWVLEEGGAVLNKYLGDGFLGYWPGGEVEVERVLGVVRGLRRMQERLGLKFRVVLHYGDTYVDRRIAIGEENLLGLEVNFVFRMEKVAARLGVDWLLSAATVPWLGDRMPLVTVGVHAVAGFAEGHEFFRADWGRVWGGGEGEA